MPVIKPSRPFKGKGYPKKYNNGRKRASWPETGILLANQIAILRSEDPYIQVGAFAKRIDGSVILGYNGAPSHVDIDWSDRDSRRKRVLHAESNVLNYCRPGEVEFLCVTHLPCGECIKSIAQKGIPTVYYSSVLENYDFQLTHDLAEEFGIKLVFLPLDKIKIPS